MAAGGCRQHGACHLFEVTDRDHRVAIAGKYDFALLGDFEMGRQRARRLASDRPTGGSSAASDGTAAAMEERQLDLVAAGPADEVRLRPVEGNVGCQEAGVLRRIGVTQHHFQVAASPLERPSPGRQLQQPVQRLGCGLEVGA